MGEKSRSGSGIRIRDDDPGSYFRKLRNNFLGLKYLNSLMRIRIRYPEISLVLDPRSGMEKLRIRDPG
jgi:hypothetical protein